MSEPISDDRAARLIAAFGRKHGNFSNALYEFAKQTLAQARAEEAEACARIAAHNPSIHGLNIASAIRARHADRRGE